MDKMTWSEPLFIVQTAKLNMTNEGCADERVNIHWKYPVCIYLVLSLKSVLKKTSLFFCLLVSKTYQKQNFENVLHFFQNSSFIKNWPLNMFFTAEQLFSWNRF